MLILTKNLQKQFFWGAFKIVIPLYYCFLSNSKEKLRSWNSLWRSCFGIVLQFSWELCTASIGITWKCQKWLLSGVLIYNVFLWKGILKICCKFTGEGLCGTVISINLQSNSVEIILTHGWSPLNLHHIFWKYFYQNTSGGILVKISDYKLNVVLRKCYSAKFTMICEDCHFSRHCLSK